MTVPLRLSCLAALPAANDQTLRRLLLVARLHAFLLAPRRHHVPAAARAATVRVIHRIHDFTADARTAALPSRLAGLAPRNQLVLLVAHDADRRQALPVDHAHLGRGHAQRDVLAFLRDDLRRHAGGTAHLPALADLHLDVVHVGTERDLRERQRVARADVGAGTGRDGVADAQSLGL